MSVMSRGSVALFLFAALSVPATGLVAQELEPAGNASETTVFGAPPADLSGLGEGPDIEGIISGRRDDKLQIIKEDGGREIITLAEATQIKSSGGFLGLDRKQLADDALLNGLPVDIKTVLWGGGLVASEIKFKDKDLKTAAMIRNGTAQRFEEQGAAIDKNAAAAEALRGRMGDIDQYNIKSTTNVYFDSGKAVISQNDKIKLCGAAREADMMDNALLLVVGYTDSTGSPEVNQRLSEKRAGTVVNYLQQACGWKPWRMLSPTGMAESDPAADNYTEAGKAQNRRVSVNVLVSKALDGF